MSLDATVILTVGTDCNIGKMTTQLQVQRAVADRGHRTHFAATGQTGVLIEGRGIAVDAVVADFIAGAAEALTVDPFSLLLNSSLPRPYDNLGIRCFWTRPDEFNRRTLGDRYYDPVWELLQDLN